MHFWLPVMVCVVEILVFKRHLSKVGRLSICAERSAAEQVFGGRHVAVAFPFFHNSFVNGDNGMFACLFSLIYLQAGTRQEPYWVINAKPTYCRSPQTLVNICTRGRQFVDVC